MTLAAVCLIPHQDARFPSELDRYINQVLVDWQIPGIAIAVVRNDSVLVAKGYGEVDANTVFDAASLTKSFTATTIGILVDRGILHWDDTVYRNITLRDFLSHRSGLEPANMMWVMTGIDRAEVLRRVRFLRAVAPPGREFIYNNVGYTVAGEAAAARLQTTLEDLIASLIIRPLRLTSTTATYARAAKMPNLAAPHATIAGRQQPIRRETQRHTIDAAGGIQTTVTDLARWMRLHLNNGVLDGRRFVSESTMREMHTRQISIPTPAMMRARLVEDSVVGYGLGLQVMDYRGRPLLWHSGNGDGQIAWMALLPQDRLGVVVLVNTWSAPMVHAALVNRILDTYLGVTPLRDWAAEARARITTNPPAAMTVHPVPLPLSAYVGRYDHPLYGPVWIRMAGSGLTLQMGTGQTADLEYHGEPGFMVTWRDPLYRENFGTHVQFTDTSLSIRINRDEFTATKSRP